MTSGLLLEPLCEPEHGCKQSPCPCAASRSTCGSAWRVRSICKLGVGALSAWFETNRQFPSQPSESNLN